MTRKEAYANSRGQLRQSRDLQACQDQGNLGLWNPKQSSGLDERKMAMSRARKKGTGFPSRIQIMKTTRSYKNM